MGNDCEGYEKDGGNPCVDIGSGEHINCTRGDCQMAGGGSCCPASAAPSDLCECMCSGDSSDCPGYVPVDPGPWWQRWLDVLSVPIVTLLCIVAALAACCVAKRFIDHRRHNQRIKRMQQGHGSLLGRQQLEHPQGHAAYGTMADEEAWVVPACPVGMASTTKLPA